MACIVAGASAQTGSLSGTVRDYESGDKLMGASVFLIGSKFGATTDLDGKYRINGIPAGLYDVRFSFMGYETLLKEQIEIDRGKNRELDARLKPIGSAVFTIEEILVTAERVLSTSTAVLTERMKAAAIGDAISAEQISRSPDATSGDALKRVTGLSVVDNKFVNVRGVTDRYNGTSLDGVNVTGTDTDVDKKSFAFDLVPAALLSNTVVVKTATPDLPGDFSGGYVQVNTLDFPSERVFTAGFSIGGEDSTTNLSMSVPSTRGGKDWLGMDDGSREYPYPDRKPADIEADRESRYELARSLPNTWGVSKKAAPYEKSFNLSYGDHFYLPGDSELGIVAAWVYRNDYSIENFNRTLQEAYNDPAAMNMNGTRSKYEVLWGLIFNTSYRFSWLGRENHKLTFKNSRTQSAQESIGLQQGVSFEQENLRRLAIEWDQRSLYVGQLGGKHSFQSVRNLELEWKYHWSRSRAEEPDRRDIDYKYDDEDYIWQLDNNHRSWAELDENLNGYGFDGTYKLPLDLKVKAGFASERRDRTYDIQSWYTDRYGLYEGRCYGKYGNLLYLPPEEIFAPENYGHCKFDFRVQTGFTGNYKGTQDILSYYGMADFPFRLAGQQFRLVGGARVEDSVQEVFTKTPFGEGNSASKIDEKDVLPSMNFTYVLNPYVEKLLGRDVKANLRLAYGRAVNRPELREMSSVLYYDFNLEQNVLGKPGLKRAVIDNYDFRFEVFPGVGEVVAFSLFKKDLTDAIEDTLRAAPERFVRSFRNAPEATNNGWEVEVRKNFGMFGGYMENLVLGVNYTRVHSRVPFVEDTEEGRVTLHRTLRGQSPWTVNASVDFTEPNLGTSVTLLYNKIGRRLDLVGDIRDTDIYEEPRGQVDLAVSQPMGYNTRLKLSAKNLSNSDKKLTISSRGFPYSTVYQGRSYSVSFSYRF
jgi:hypothetical protein